MALLSPREGLSRHEFNEYWLRKHGPLVARTPGYGRYRVHYSQDHVQGQGPWGRPFGYAGLAQILFPVTADAPINFSETWQFRDRILPDEQKFLNRQTSVAFAVDRVQLRLGRGLHKVVILSAPGFGLGTEEIRFEYLQHYLHQAVGSRLLAAQVAGWTVGFVTTPPTSMDGTQINTLESFACVEEVWFETWQAMRAWASELTCGAASVVRRRMFSEEASSSFVSREYVFFRDGKPTEIE
jgi:hypothetical protein